MKFVPFPKDVFICLSKENYLLKHFGNFSRQPNDTILSFVTVLAQVIHTFDRGHEVFFQVSEFTAILDDEVIGLFSFQKGCIGGLSYHHCRPPTLGILSSD